PNSGYVVYGEGGVLHGQRGKSVAYDNDGKKIAQFSGSGDVKHQANFLEAVRNDDSSMLNANIEIGNDSTGWCNLANIAFQVGDSGASERFNSIDIEPWDELSEQTSNHLESHGLSFESSDFRFSKLMTLNEKTGQFDEPKANDLLKREYRKGYEVPQIA
ncbi:MAG: gfo/Idh/MocA family oxidoreductase, partial [Planctomycetota bacterium]